MAAVFSGAYTELHESIQPFNPNFLRSIKILFAT
jgi:hypothetical protein